MISMAGLNLPGAGDAAADRQRHRRGDPGQPHVGRARKIMTISEIVGMEGDVITMQDIFVFEREGTAEDGSVIGSFRSTGIRPTFLALTVGAALSVGASVFVLTNNVLYMLVGAVLGSLGPLMYVKRRKRQRVEAFEAGFGEAIDLLARSIRAGHAFATGLKVVAEEAQPPVSTEFKTVFDEQKFGLPLEESMLGLADRIDLVDIRIFVTAILVQRDVGGNLAEILDKISYTIRERFMIQRQIRVYTAQGRMTGYLLAALPIIMGFLIYLLNPEYMSILWEEQVGRLLIAAAFMLQIIGFVVIRRIVDIEV
jgi:tight adherence protein B